MEELPVNLNLCDHLIWSCVVLSTDMGCIDNQINNVLSRDAVIRIAVPCDSLIKKNKKKAPIPHDPM